MANNSKKISLVGENHSDIVMGRKVECYIDLNTRISKKCNNKDVSCYEFEGWRSSPFSITKEGKYKRFSVYCVIDLKTKEEFYTNKREKANNIYKLVCNNWN